MLFKKKHLLIRNEEGFGLRGFVKEWNSSLSEVILGLFLCVFRMSRMSTFHCPRQEVCDTNREQSSG